MSVLAVADSPGAMKQNPAGEQLISKTVQQVGNLKITTLVEALEPDACSGPPEHQSDSAANDVVKVPNVDSDPLISAGADRTANLWLGDEHQQSPRTQQKLKKLASTLTAKKASMSPMARVDRAFEMGRIHGRELSCCVQALTKPKSIDLQSAVWVYPSVQGDMWWTNAKQIYRETAQNHPELHCVGFPTSKEAEAYCFAMDSKFCFHERRRENCW